MDAQIHTGVQGDIHSSIYTTSSSAVCTCCFIQPSQLSHHTFPPSAMPWFRNPDVSDDPISLHPGSPALGSWFENLLGDKSTPLLLTLLFASLHRLGTEFKTLNSTACTTVSYFTVQTGEPHNTWRPSWETTDKHTDCLHWNIITRIFWNTI